MSHSWLYGSHVINTLLLTWLNVSCTWWCFVMNSFIPMHIFFQHQRMQLLENAQTIQKNTWQPSMHWKNCIITQKRPWSSSIWKISFTSCFVPLMSHNYQVLLVKQTSSDGQISYSIWDLSRSQLAPISKNNLLDALYNWVRTWT